MSDKVILQNEIDEMPLPEGVSYDTLTGKPTSLADISITDATILASVSSGSPAGGLDLSIQGWQFDGTFSASSATAIAWTAGTLRFKDGTTFAIASGSVSGLSTTVPTYIYFSKVASLTVLQTSVTATAAVGQNKVLMGVVQGNAAAGKNAIFQVFGGAGGMSPFVSGVNIAASSITSAMIVAGTIVASNIAAGTITANEIAVNTITANKIASNTITANKMDVANLASINANIGAITAGTIDGVTITGGTIRTSSGSSRIEMNSGNVLDIYNSSVLRMRLSQTTMNYYNSSGNAVGGILVDASGDFNVGANAGAGGPNLLLLASSGGNVKMIDSGVTNMDISQSQILFLANRFNLTQNHFSASSNNAKDLGDGTNAWRNLYLGGWAQIGKFLYLGQLSGTAAASETTINGALYYRTDDNVLRVYLNGAWKTITTA